MGTRGSWGYRLDGALKVTYNHFDSYPSGLGAAVHRHARDLAEDPEARTKVAALTLVDEDDAPTAEQLAALRNVTGDVSEARDWYWALHGLQGDPGAILSAGYMTDGRDFAEHGSRCMWVYVIDMDAGELIVHAGDMSTPVVASWPLTGLPSAEEFRWAAVRAPSIPL